MRKKFFIKSDGKTKVEDLIIFGIYSITKNKEKCTFERLIKECFILFPEIFSFPSFKCPDSRKIDRPLRNLRKKKLIKGDPMTSFSLTKSGKKIVIEILKTFRQRKLKI